MGIVLQIITWSQDFDMQVLNVIITIKLFVKKRQARSLPKREVKATYNNNINIISEPNYEHKHKKR